MWLEVFNANAYGTNCWLLAADGSDRAIAVDPGFEPPALEAILGAAGKQLEAVILTHAHLDHAAVAGDLAGDLPVFVHEADAVAFTDEAAWNAGFANPLTDVKDLRSVRDGDVLAFEALSVEVLHTPGHTPGHCAFRTEDRLFSGDLVFAGSIGRSDFPNSSPTAMRASLLRFLTLPDGLPVLPGHGPDTSVGRERDTNPFLAGLR